VQYREFGNTGASVSILGFGAMRLPTHRGGKVDLDRAVPILQRGIDLGINYIDSAHSYIRGTSEVAVGKAIKSHERPSLHVATKIMVGSLHTSDPKSWLRKLDVSLQRLDTPYIDFIYFHDFRWREFQDYVAGKGKILEAARRVQAQGLVRHICFSSHDSVDNIAKLIDTGEFEGLLLQYNCLDRHNVSVIDRASQRGMGVAIMGPLAGGRLVRPIEPAPPGEQEFSAAALGLRFVWSNPAVSVALSGMNAFSQVEENAAAADRTEMTEAELAQVQRLVTKSQGLADLYCTGCGYCMPCPNEVDIPENFRYLNWLRVWGLEKEAKTAYEQLGAAGTTAGESHGLRADACVQCGECEPKCPQNIPIIEQLEQASETLGS
jgi:predicted aldo/keto reductase-like oxidoreductase